MYIMVEDNPNCPGQERVFATTGPKRQVSKIYIEKDGEKPAWWDVSGVDETGQFSDAAAQQVEDSSDGIAWLITGGAWGLRFRRSDQEPWSLTSTQQWGTPFLVLDSAGREIQFK